MKDVTASETILSSPERILEAFLDIEDMRHWWDVDQGTIEARTGGLWAISWGRSEHGYRYVSTGTIGTLREREFLHINNLVQFNPERGVFGPMQLTITVAPAGNHTSLTIRQDGYGDSPDWKWLYDSAALAWPEALKRLKSYLESN